MSTSSSVNQPAQKLNSQQRLYLKVKGRKPVLVEFRAIEGGYVVEAVHDPAVKFALMFEQARPSRQPSAPAHWRRVLTITPAEVVQYFEQSPDLHGIAEDVRTALGVKKNGGQGQIDEFEQDLERVLHLGPEAGPADICEIIYEHRQPAGSQFRYVKRLQKALKSTTSTNKKSTTTPSEARKAA